MYAVIGDMVPQGLSDRKQSCMHTFICHRVCILNRMTAATSITKGPIVNATCSN
jgi:hypothetical protein